MAYIIIEVPTTNEAFAMAFNLTKNVLVEYTADQDAIPEAVMEIQQNLDDVILLKQRDVNDTY